MTDAHKCRNCGSLSSDPEWCDICGADLLAQAAQDTQLEIGDQITVTITQPLSDPQPLPMMASAETLPPRDTTDVGWSATQSGGLPATNGETKRPASTKTFGRVALPASISQPNGGRDAVILQLEELVTKLTHKRVFRAAGNDGQTYRVEERHAPSPEPVPDAIRNLTWLVDVPLGVTKNGTHEIKVYRHVEGETLFERMQARETPLTPSEIVEWMRPIAEAIGHIHNAGFLCLRLCPYTIKYTSADRIFLQGVEVLYPQDAALDKLPAIAGYTAPEVYNASVGEPPDHTADFYMAGMIVYYLIAGVDPPASMYTGYAPAILARDFNPDFPLGFAPVLGVLGALEPGHRPDSASTFMHALIEARERSVRQIERFDDFRLAVASDTHVGIVKRVSTPVNQDAVFSALDVETGTAMLVVADGVSTASYGSGDQASALARHVAIDAWNTLQSTPEVVREMGVSRWLDAVIQEINRAVVEAVNEAHAPFDGEPSEVMGSTCMLALTQNGITHLLSLGDSRAYLIRNGFMEQINRDHNLLTLGITEGLSADTAITLPHSDALARCLGAFDVDAEGNLIPIDVEADLYIFALQPGDRLLLATDGLTDYAAEDVGTAEALIYETVMRGELPDLTCMELLTLANMGGGGDNIGVALAFADPPFANPYEWFTATRSDYDDMEEPDEDASAV